MSANKVYESIVKLLFNVVHDDRLKYYLFSNPKYREKFVNLVNNLLTLEINEDALFNDEQWAKTFGKAIVIISREKQRIEKTDNSVEQIYQDYSEFISYTNHEYKKNDLDRTTINFTSKEVISDAKLSDTQIEKFKELDQKETEENERKSQQEEAQKTVNNSEPKLNENPKRSDNQQNAAFNPFMNNFNQDMIPLNPTLDPRFYPYTRKPKWFPIAKLALGIAGILASVMLVILTIFALTNAINFRVDNIGIGSWAISEHNNAGWATISDISTVYSIDGQTRGFMISSPFIYFLGAIMIGYAFLRKPRNLKEKYRISYFYYFIIIILYMGSITFLYRFVSPDSIKLLWQNAIKSWLNDSNTFNQGQFDSWWSNIYVDKHVQTIQILGIVGIALMGVFILGIIVLMFIQPHVDQQKMQKANYEYQMAISAMMQGQEYQMDPSLFEDEKEVIIRKKSKLKIWWDKTFKRTKDKKKD